MGAAFVNHWLTSTIGWTIAVGILAINASDVYEFASNEVAGRHWMLGLLITTVALYLTFVLYLTIGPIRYRTALLNPKTPVLSQKRHPYTEFSKQRSVWGQLKRFSTLWRCLSYSVVSKFVGMHIRCCYRPCS